MIRLAVIVLISLFGISIQAISAETYNTGAFSVFAPDGWEAHPFYHASSGEINPDTAGVYKGLPDDYGRGLIPGMQITVRKGLSVPPKSMYQGAEDIEPVTIGNHTWNGFIVYQQYTGTVYMPLTVLWATVGDKRIQIGAYAPRGEKDKIKHISLDDPDVRAIIASITPEGTEISAPANTTPIKEDNKMTFTGKDDGGTKSVEFSSLPVTMEQFTALPQAEMQSPYDTAAMFVVALNHYAQNKDESIAMINFLKGPAPLSPRDISLFKTQVTDYLVRSYFAGATPQNDYAPSQPYAVVISDNVYSYATSGSVKLFVQCGGADSPRPIEMRQAKDGKWYLSGYSSLLVGIMKPESSNPWN